MHYREAKTKKNTQKTSRRLVTLMIDLFFSLLTKNRKDNILKLQKLQQRSLETQAVNTVI